VVSPKSFLVSLEFNIESADFNIEFGDYKTASSRFKTTFQQFNIESRDYMIVPGRFKTGFAQFNIEFDAYKTDRSRFKIEIRQFKTVQPRFNVQLLPSCFPIQVNGESDENLMARIRLNYQLLSKKNSTFSFRVMDEDLKLCTFTFLCLQNFAHAC